jgi:hypothetical protein
MTSAMEVSRQHRGRGPPVAVRLILDGTGQGEAPLEQHVGEGVGVAGDPGDALGVEEFGQVLRRRPPDEVQATLEHPDPRARAVHGPSSAAEEPAHGALPDQVDDLVEAAPTGIRFLERRSRHKSAVVDREHDRVE